ncbi:YitT family protein [Lacticaseibacillus thailandensis]|uniref:Membrane protein n=1 Tax=Lacticaseibacillus thailandensis DSM 22698 = JCM 13996 TaxID=1423810 RepID=A0A0R2CK75_9LACO|nr:YitT family protein [Lacticaseibacillus thailandensis]KRM88147.1 membrane protein [Lacticaseibacillus thailandensis DSM 22698 = JCM 13996]
MQELDRLIRRHQNWSRLSAAFLYAVCVSVALNMFWEPGGVYASGITGAAQLIAAVVQRWFNFALPGGIKMTDVFPTGTWLFLLNVPLFILAWRKIGHRFTMFTFLAVVFSTIMLRLIHVPTLTTDPIICGIFGAVVNGFGTGFALRNNISTGGLDILGLVIRKRTGSSIGQVNIAFNIIIVVLAGAMYSWPHALISALSIFINGRIIDSLYTRQQRLQVMIVTAKPHEVINTIQSELRHGITIVHDVEGAFKHQEKTILFTVISRAEMNDLGSAVKKADQYAFVSMTEAVKIMGRFYEPQIR